MKNDLKILYVNEYTCMKIVHVLKNNFNLEKILLKIQV